MSPFSGEAIISPSDKNDANDARKLLRVSPLTYNNPVFPRVGRTPAVNGMLCDSNGTLEGE